MEGAEALAMPLKQGQSLVIEHIEGSELIWQSFEMGRPWFLARYTLPDVHLVTEKNEVSLRLQRLLRFAAEMNPGHLDDTGGIKASTDADFHLKWGFGSSSTLLSNIAYWFDVEPFGLFRKEFTGSGYDVACARSDKAILYRLFDDMPFFETVEFDPPFSSQLYFIYLGKKQNTTESIYQFRKKGGYASVDIEAISGITRHIAEKVTDIDDFDRLIHEHEAIMSKILSVAAVKDRLFPDFPGAIKSLGSWGGDFILATWQDAPEGLLKYFKSKGLDTVFRFDDLKP